MEFCFFFSSRRRHTRCGRNWSSDVCSSDLVGLVLDRKHERIVVVAHPHGGMEIEEIAQREPAAILREVVEPAVGMRSFQARELAFGLGLGAQQVNQAVTARCSRWT